MFCDIISTAYTYTQVFIPFENQQNSAQPPPAPNTDYYPGDFEEHSDF